MFAGMFSSLFSGAGAMATRAEASFAGSGASALSGAGGSSGGSAPAALDSSGGGDVQLPGVGNYEGDQNGDLCGAKDQFSFDDSDAADEASPQDSYTPSAPPPDA